MEGASMPMKRYTCNGAPRRPPAAFARLATTTGTDARFNSNACRQRAQSKAQKKSSA